MTHERPPVAATPPPPGYHVEEFTAEERAVLGRFFTNLDGPVFAVVNLPEVVKGALFARYSRSPKSVRRLFLDEFYAREESGIAALAERVGADPEVGRRRAEALYDRVFGEYGDDSVAQLGGAHVACEQASNLLTKVLEWGRLAAYLEQSTRYIVYDRTLGGRYRYHVPAEIAASPLADLYRETMDELFTNYSELLDQVLAHYEERHPRPPDDPASVWRATIRARACDDVRGLLPAATTSNVGIFASGQAYEMLLVRMRAHPLEEVRAYADLLLTELRKVIPAFMRRVDRPDRGGAWSAYLAATARAVAAAAADLELPPPPASPEVRLVEWDPEAETKIAAAALYAITDLPDATLLDVVRRLPAARRADLLRAYVGTRGNRRHKPGRAMERCAYRFDILADYGIFRDLQRHRMLTIEWQRLSPAHGYVTPPTITRLGLTARWDAAMARAAELYERVRRHLGPDVAQYVVPFAYRIRFFLHLDVREAFHLLELRTQPGGHPGYRRVCQEMHRLIRDEAGHRLLAEAMRFVDHRDHELGRLQGERRAAARRDAADRVRHA